MNETPEPGEYWRIVADRAGRLVLAYTYKGPDGRRFKCAADTLEAARRKRRTWQERAPRTWQQRLAGLWLGN